VGQRSDIFLLDELKPEESEIPDPSQNPGPPPGYIDRWSAESLKP
jgi:hypothetical protein